MKRAHAAYQRGEPDTGIADLQRAEELLDPEPDSKLAWSIRYSLVLYAVEAGHLASARRRFREQHSLLESRNEPWYALRLLWLRAKLARVEGRDAEAREHYGRAREGFLAEGMGFDAALVSMELALLYLGAGDWAGVQQLAAEMMPIFQAQDVHREALAALALFEEAARKRELSVALASQFRRYLQLAQRDPSLTFRQFQREIGVQGKETS